MDKKPKTPARTKLELLDLKIKARKLYITDNVPAKDIGLMLNVSQNSLSAWVKRFGWIEKKQKALYVKETGVTMAKLKRILKAVHPELAETIETVFENLKV